jgi:ribosome-associated protein YbcJ (S4-like RNA binding protein)
MEKEFVLQGEYIELYKLLKVMNIAATGGMVKYLSKRERCF